MAYRVAAIPMTLSDFKVIHPLQAFSSGIFLYSCAAFDNIVSALRGPTMIGGHVVRSSLP